MLTDILVQATNPHSGQEKEKENKRFALSWAELTWEAPGPAHSGTAERLGADEAC